MERRILRTAEGIKLAFFDLDGTLIAPSGEISPEAIKEIKRIQKNGVLVGAASGRPLFSALPYMEALGMEALSVLFSGALIYDPQSKSVFWKDGLSPEVTAALIRLSRKWEIPLELYTQDAYFIERPSRLSDIHTGYLKKEPIVANLEEIPKREDIIKAVFILDERDGEKKEKFIAEVEPLATVACGKGAAHPNITYANVTSPLASREAAFEKIINYYNLSPKEVIAFGDELSDIPFLTMAGIGVAMQASPPEVKACADYIADSVDKDGVASVIREIF